MFTAHKFQSPLIRSLAIGLAVCCFGICVHAPYPGSIFAGFFLLLLAWLISKALADYPAILFAMSVWKWPVGYAKTMWIAIIGSVIVSIIYRYAEQMPLFPVGITPFVIVAVMIGAAEEVLFRGVIQGEAMRYRPKLAVFISAIVFAVYKALLFSWPSEINHVNQTGLFFLTFIAAILLGISRMNSKSILPAIAAHGLFDLYVYAETAKAPWWVW